MFARIDTFFSVSASKVDNSLPFLSGIASTAEVVKSEPHSLHVSSHNAMTC